MGPIKALRHQAETRPKGVAFIAGDDVWTYERLAAEVERLAGGLVARGLRKGDRIALHMANRPELIVAYYACFQTGAIAAPLNNRFKTAELTTLLQRLQPSLYIGQADLYSQAVAIDSSILASDIRFIVGGAVDDPRARPWARLFGNALGKPVPAASDVQAPALLFATSGTTGQPKIVIHTLGTLAEIAESWKHLGLDGDQVAIQARSMAHAGGLFTFLGSIRFGAPVILHEHFDPDAVLDAIERHQGTWIALLPFMYVALLNHQRAHARDVDSLRTCLAAGDVCSRQQQDQFLSVFGTPLRSYWASTEAFGSLSYGTVPGPVSRIVAGAQVRLVNDSGTLVPRGEVGELVLRGSNVTIGYWAGPGLIEDAPKDGWFHTGDLMRQGEHDDLWFVSRKKDVIIRGGSNISPAEVERVLIAHPAVQDAAVVGVPDALFGQRVVGFVQLASGVPSTVLDEIFARVAEQLADYKVPESLNVVREIPRNTAGKIDRGMLLTMIPEYEDSEVFAIP